MNKVFLSGFIADSSVKKIENDKTTIYTFQIRCKKEFADGSDFINITTFGNSAQYFEKYYKSNKFVEIFGHITQAIYTDKAGKKQYKEQVIADEIKIIETFAEEKEKAKEEIQQQEIEVYETEIVDNEVVVEETKEVEASEPSGPSNEIKTEVKEEEITQKSANFDEFY
ncbi:single-stranded DNA-binding protein [Mycoplasma sp. Z244C]